jgi:hypothetical protein
VTHLSFDRPNGLGCAVLGTAFVVQTAALRFALIVFVTAHSTLAREGTKPIGRFLDKKSQAVASCNGGIKTAEATAVLRQTRNSCLSLRPASPGPDMRSSIAVGDRTGRLTRLVCPLNRSRRFAGLLQILRCRNNFWPASAGLCHPFDGAHHLLSCGLMEHVASSWNPVHHTLAVRCAAARIVFRCRPVHPLRPRG